MQNVYGSKLFVFATLIIASLATVGCRNSALDSMLNGTARAQTQSAVNKSVIATSNAKKTEYAATKAVATRAPISTSNSTSGCVEYDAPFTVVFIDGSADVYAGVDRPSSSVKGTITGGAAGIEARCGTYYRLRGVDWWGWVRVSDTYK